MDGQIIAVYCLTSDMLRALIEDNTHVEAVVLFRFRDGPDLHPVPNNYVVTAYLVARW